MSVTLLILLISENTYIQHPLCTGAGSKGALISVGMCNMVLQSDSCKNTACIAISQAAMPDPIACSRGASI